MSKGTGGLDLGARALGFAGRSSGRCHVRRHGARPLVARRDTGPLRYRPLTPPSIPKCRGSLSRRGRGGILGVHLRGGPCDLDSLTALCRTHELRSSSMRRHAVRRRLRRWAGPGGATPRSSASMPPRCECLRGGGVVDHQRRRAAAGSEPVGASASSGSTRAALGTTGRRASRGCDRPDLVRVFEYVRCRRRSERCPRTSNARAHRRLGAGPRAMGGDDDITTSSSRFRRRPSALHLRPGARDCRRGASPAARSSIWAAIERSRIVPSFAEAAVEDGAGWRHEGVQIRRRGPRVELDDVAAICAVFLELVPRADAACDRRIGLAPPPPDADQKAPLLSSARHRGD